mmetsp:Transcript_23899/g.59557  ORF Transcript_23899/g.59557 Transcript_23899/m.59557 type:complete len:325 (+) Transcript_23899:293-1267(+)
MNTRIKRPSQHTRTQISQVVTDEGYPRRTSVKILFEKRYPLSQAKMISTEVRVPCQTPSVQIPGERCSAAVRSRVHVSVALGLGRGLVLERSFRARTEIRVTSSKPCRNAFNCASTAVTSSVRITSGTYSCKLQAVTAFSPPPSHKGTASPGSVKSRQSSQIETPSSVTAASTFWAVTPEASSACARSASVSRRDRARASEGSSSATSRNPMSCRFRAARKKAFENGRSTNLSSNNALPTNRPSVRNIPVAYSRSFKISFKLAPPSSSLGGSSGRGKRKQGPAESPGGPVLVAPSACLPPCTGSAGVPSDRQRGAALSSAETRE